jgi:uncharacterized membrane protein YtjA (UPF0391 family)
MRPSGYTQLATLMAVLFMIVSLLAMLLLGYGGVERIMATPLFQIIFTILAIIFITLVYLGRRAER